jgi:hypothetical protein
LQQAFARRSNVDEAVFSFDIYLQIVGGRAFVGGAVMSRNQPVLVAPILGLSLLFPLILL